MPSLPFGAWAAPNPTKDNSTDLEGQRQDIEEFALQEMRNASYSSYFGAVLAYAIKQGLTSNSYAEFFSSGPTTDELVQQHKMRPLCSTAYVEKYLRNEFNKKWASA